MGLNALHIFLQLQPLLPVSSDNFARQCSSIYISSQEFSAATHQKQLRHMKENTQ